MLPNGTTGFINYAVLGGPCLEGQRVTPTIIDNMCIIQITDPAGHKTKQDIVANNDVVMIYFPSANGYFRKSTYDASIWIADTSDPNTIPWWPKIILDLAKPTAQQGMTFALDNAGMSLFCAAQNNEYIMTATSGYQTIMFACLNQTGNIDEVPSISYCQSDQDCQDPLLPHCNTTTGACVQCNGDTDCPKNYHCTNNTCVKNPGCQSDQDCHDPNLPHCDKDTGDCVRCLQDADCPIGYHCVGNACVIKPGCQSDRDCLLGQACVEGKCISTTCKVDQDCQSGFYCNHGICAHDCQPNNCPSKKCVDHKCASSSKGSIAIVFIILGVLLVGGFLWFKVRKMKTGNKRG